MKSSFIMPLLILSAIPASFQNRSNTSVPGNTHLPTNPFFTTSTLPYQAPPFDKIRDADFKPAFEEGMKLHQEEIQKIADNPSAPCFENTMVALEKSGQLLTRVSRVFNVLTGANTNAELQRIKQDEASRLAVNQDEIYLNAKLIKRIRGRDPEIKAMQKAAGWPVQ